MAQTTANAGRKRRKGQEAGAPARETRSGQMPAPQQSPEGFSSKVERINPVVTLLGSVLTLVATAIPVWVLLNGPSEPAGVIDHGVSDTGSTGPGSAGSDRCTAVSPTPSQGPIRICDVLANPAGPEPQDEKIVLCNTSQTPVTVGTWRLQDNHGEYVVPENTTIAPGSSWEIEGSTFNPEGKTTGKIYLNNGHDCVILLDAKGTRIDSRVW